MGSERVKIKLLVIPDLQSDIDEMEYDKATDGSIFSSATNINVNKTRYGYSVLYQAHEFTKMKMSTFLASLIKLFSDNLKDSSFKLSIRYAKEDLKPINVDGIVIYNLATIVRLVSEIDDLVVLDDYAMDYIESAVNEIEEDNNDDSQEEQITTGDDQLDALLGLTAAPESFADDFDGDTFTQLLLGDNNEEDEEEDADDILAALLDNDKKKKKKKEYDPSRILKESKNPKKEIKLHGVIINDSKKDVKRDERTIKEFLKDFIPGSAEWKKEFRNDLAKRWLKMYTVDKKQLKELEKQHKKKMNRKKINRNKKILNFTDKLFNVPVNNWYDPSR